MEENTTYYARVRYRSDQAGVSAWSDASSFTTDNGPEIDLESGKFFSASPTAQENFGFAIALNSAASYALIGTPFLTGQTLSPGSVKVFERSGEVWNQIDVLVSSDGVVGDGFGGSIAVNADASMALVAAQNDDDNSLSNSGAVYVFTRSGSTWTQEQKLYAGDPSAGAYFGGSVALSADGLHALIGSAATRSVYYFTRSGSVWTQQQKFGAIDDLIGNNFGSDVALSADGTYAMIGATGAQIGGVVQGAAYIFTRAGNVWSQDQRIDPNPIITHDSKFGTSVTLNAAGDVALISAWGATVEELANAGIVYVLKRNGGDWVVVRLLSAGDKTSNARFGNRACLNGSGDYALIASVLDSTMATNAGAVYVFK